jgi:D-glycero-alpha-D-manno-heptose 1-phosphate guanylyltransferase
MQNLKSITAIILAGGFGTRLRSAVSDQPKVLAKVGGRAFLTYLLDHLASFDIRNVVLATGHMGDQIRTTFGNHYGLIRLFYSHELSPLGTAGALRIALPLLKSNPVLVMNGDSFCPVNLQAFLDWHHARNAKATFLLTEVPDPSRYGQVDLSADQRISKFVEKGTNGNPGWISAGIYLIQRRLLSTIPEEHPVSLEKDMFPNWMKQGIYGYRVHEKFIDIGTPESYSAAQEFFLAGANSDSRGNLISQAQRVF